MNMKRFCTSCGNEIAADTVFCDNCGTPNKDVPVAESTETSQQLDTSVGPDAESPTGRGRRVLLVAGAATFAIAVVIAGVWWGFLRAPEISEANVNAGRENSDKPVTAAKSSGTTAKSDNSGSTTPHSKDLSDRESKILFESAMNRRVISIPLGLFFVMHPDYAHTGGKDSISAQMHEDLLAWAKIGLLDVTLDEKFENIIKGPYSLEQRDWIVNKNVRAKIAVSATESGKRYVDPANSRQIIISEGTFTISKVAKNEEKKKGLDDYRLLMLSFDAAYNPLVKQFKQIMGSPLEAKRKAIVLLKWDPFSSRWNFVAIDAANESEEFKTNRVANALSGR